MVKKTYLHFSKPGEKPKPLGDLDDAMEAARKSGFVWLDFVDPKHEDLFPLFEKFGVHQLSIEDCVDENQIPKMDRYPENTFYLFNYFSYKDKKLAVEEIDFIISKNFLVTVHGHHCDDSDLFREIPLLIERRMAQVSEGSDFLMHVILDHIVDKKFEAITRLQDEIEQAEETVIDSSEKFHPVALMHLRRTLITLRKSLYYEREMLIKMCRRDCPFLTEKSIYFYRDVYDHLAKFFEFIEINREAITSLMELYLSMRSNQMAEASNQTNNIMKRLTIITTIFMPLTLLSGIGGMSEWSMMTGAENWKISYPIFLLGMVVIGVANFLVLRWKGWT